MNSSYDEFDDSMYYDREIDRMKQRMEDLELKPTQGGPRPVQYCDDCGRPKDMHGSRSKSRIEMPDGRECSFKWDRVAPLSQGNQP